MPGFVGGGVMNNTQEGKTIAIKSCALCEAGLLETDKYCRRCGSQNSNSRLHEAADASDSAARERVTHHLDKADICHPVSGPLMKAVARGIPAASSSGARQLLGRRLILAFISVPIWLMIVLLSPFDAYTAAKIISNRI